MSRNLRLAIAVGAVLGANTALAQDWEFAPVITLNAVTNDNYVLATTPSLEDEVTGAVGDAILALQYTGPRSNVRIAPRARASIYPDDEEDESDDYFLNFDWSFRSPRTTAGFEALVSKENIVDAELARPEFDDVELGQPVGGDSGQAIFSNDRELIYFRPTYAYQFSQRARFEFGAAYFDADYVGGVGSQVDFTDASVSAGVTFQATQRSEISVLAVGSRFEPDTGEAETTRLGADVQWSMQQTQQMQLYARLGVRETEFDAGDGSDTESETGFVGGIGGAWTLQVTRILADYLRSVEPSSVGEVVDRDELRLRLERDLSPLFTIFAGARGIRARTSIEGLQQAAFDDRDYYAANLGLQWRINRQFTLGAQYEYLWQEFKVNEASGASNAVVVGLTWEPRRPTN